MARSLRWRLLVWSGLLLVLVVAGFGSALTWQIRAARYAEIDADLDSNLRLLEGTLRTFPKRMLVESVPPGGFAPNPSRPKGPPPPPGGLPPLKPETLLKALDLPGGRADATPFFAVWNGRGEVLKATPLPDDYPDAEVLLADVPPATTPTARQRGPYRERSLVGPEGSTILVGRGVHAELAELDRLGWRVVLVGVAAVLVGLVGVGWVATRAVRPIELMSATAASITASNLSRRIDTARSDSELGQLGYILNAMFDRLETAFDQQVRFTADASHELRTPLAVLLSHLELALARDRPAEEYRKTLVTCQRAARRMQALVADLLTLARADAGRLELVRERIDLGLLVEETLALLEPLAREHAVTLTASPATAEVHGDPERLARVLTNLVTNAILYNRPGGRVEVTLRRDGDAVEVAVADTGVGIAAEHLPHLFERFYRVDAARSRDSGGSGLGLAICHSIVTAHGGTLAVTSEPGVGTSVVARLPLGVE